MRFIVCETTAAITTHYRFLKPNEEPNYSGSTGDKRTLCGQRVGWDLEHDMYPRCRKCRVKLGRKKDEDGNIGSS